MKDRAAIARIVAEICAGKLGADKDLERLARKADDPAVAWRLAAVSFGSAGRYDLAAKAQQGAVSVLGGTANASPDDRMYLADLFRQAGLMDSSRSTLKELLADHPDFLPACLAFASHASMVQDFAEAARVTAPSTAITPRTFLPWMALRVPQAGLARVMKHVKLDGKA